MGSILFPRSLGNSSVTPLPDGWHFEIHAGESTGYRLAQVDDYVHLGRRHFQHEPPWELRLRARVSAPDLPGTWGFGLWNDPFGLSIGFGGKKKQLPALPQVAWFMHASKPNWLALQDAPILPHNRTIPANGFFAGTLRSRPISSGWFIPGIPALPFFISRAFSRLVRRTASRHFVRQDGIALDVDVTTWHEYSIRWLEDECFFKVDGKEVLWTSISPLYPLGLVIWIDNQFAAWTPEGRISYGTLKNPTSWLEVQNLILTEPFP